MTAYHLAQLNIATFKAPKDHPQNEPFVSALDRVNAVAEKQEGFVWRLVGEGNNAMDVQALDDPNAVVNLSVWRDLDSLAEFVYRNDVHKSIMRRRREWFERMDNYLVLWWVEAGAIPTVDEALARLAHLQANGPSPHAFTFRQPFNAGDEGKADPVLDECA